jgi:hypothetical protein
MAYIGNTATTQAFTPAVDYFNGDGSTVAFTLSKPVASVAQVQAVIENVPQNPGSAYTVSGNTITFTSAPPSGTANIYVYYTSPITQVIAPSQGTVNANSLASGLSFSQWTTTGSNIYYNTGNVLVNDSSLPSALSTNMRSIYVKGQNNGVVAASSNDGGSSVTLYSGANSSDDPAITYQNDLRFGSVTDIGTGGFAERVRFLASGGITFNGDTAAANALDDYEEGTWTPVVIGSSTAGSATYSSQGGTYLKIGGLVFFRCFIGWSSGTGSGQLIVTGLPFTCSGYTAVTISYPNNINAGTNNYIANGFIEQSTTYFFPVQAPVGGGGTPALTYDAAGELMASGCYRV